MKTKLLTILLCVLPALIAAQNYEKEGDDLYAQSNYELAIKKYNAAQVVAGESASVSQKIAKAKKCNSLLNQARLAEQRATQSNSATDYDKASQLYASLFAEHASPAYKSKSAAMKQKAESIRSQVRAEEERVRIEQQRQLQARQEQEQEQERIQKEEELKKRREERLVRIMNLIPKDGAKQWIYDKRKLVHEYYMDKNSEGAYVDGHNFVCELLLTNDNVYSIELFVRNSTVEELKKLLSYKEIWGNLNGKYVGNRCVIETFRESVSEKWLAECIKRTIDKMRQTRRVFQQSVDLGLSVKWATCNVGAANPWDYGDYFAWGETVPCGKNDLSNAHNYAYTGNTSYVKTYYKWDTYKWCNGTSFNTLTKYNFDSKYGTVDVERSLSTYSYYKYYVTLYRSDDAARANMGDYWRMPTEAEQQELIRNCYWEWTDNYNGKNVAGYIVYRVKDASDKGKMKYSGGTVTTVGSYSLSDAHIFLPAAGYRSSSYLISDGYYGYYWSSLLYRLPSCAYNMEFYSEYVKQEDEFRYIGLSVRAVIR